MLVHVGGIRVLGELPLNLTAQLPSHPESRRKESPGDDRCAAHNNTKEARNQLGNYIVINLALAPPGPNG
jgi:hypothetical protein